MKRDITFKHVWNWACVPKNGGIVLMLILFLVLTSIVSARAKQKEIADTYEKGHEAGYVAAELAFYKEPEALADGTTLEQLEREADVGAKALYAMRDNSDAGLRMAIRCYINRSINRDYPDSFIDVCQEPGQVMGYSDDNPILQRLYIISYEELYYHHNGGRCPMSPDHVFLAWTPDEITLRTDFEEKNHCKYFYENDWKEFEEARNGG